MCLDETRSCDTVGRGETRWHIHCSVECGGYGEQGVFLSVQGWRVCADEEDVVSALSGERKDIHPIRQRVVEYSVRCKALSST
jgi:hypothetical protein